MFLINVVALMVTFELVLGNNLQEQLNLQLQQQLRHQQELLLQHQKQLEEHQKQLEEHQNLLKQIENQLQQSQQQYQLEQGHKQLDPLQSQHEQSLQQQPQQQQTQNQQKPEVVIQQEFAQQRATSLLIENSIQELALDLTDVQFHLGHRGNQVLSPLSIGSVLSLLLLATNGKSHNELRFALHYIPHVGQEIFHSQYQKTLAKLNSTNEGVAIKLANRLFLQKDVQITPSFAQKAQIFYKTDASLQDFKRDAVGATRNVNNWVNYTTSGKIPELITLPFSPLTAMVAVNAMYFKGAWETQFPQLFTSERKFSTGTRDIVVPMMFNLVNISHFYSNELDADLISLPYKGLEFAFYAIIPRGTAESVSLNDIEFRLNAENIAELVRSMKDITAHIGIPRMRLNSKTYLKEVLKKLHLSTIFDADLADFSDMTPHHVWLSNIIHEAVLEITETGTEGAAATATSLDRIAHQRFIMNKPSIVFIREVKSGLTLFWAHVVEPEPIYNSQTLVKG